MSWPKRLLWGVGLIAVLLLTWASAAVTVTGSAL
jgi:hypothetical protein